jgi:hypothetical protein
LIDTNQHRAVKMSLNKLLLDATAAEPESSQASRYGLFAEMLNSRNPDTPVTWGAVSKWFIRGRIPGWALIEIAKASEESGRPINIADYAEQPTDEDGDE